jgi:hypothetical protein
MDGSATAIWIIVGVAVAGLVVWLAGVALAARKPYQEHAHGERLRGEVQGGMHVGSGRSVAPRRDEEVILGEVPDGDTLHPGAQHPGTSTESSNVRQGSGSPLDL